MGEQRVFFSVMCNMRWNGVLIGALYRIGMYTPPIEMDTASECRYPLIRDEHESHETIAVQKESKFTSSTIAPARRVAIFPSLFVLFRTELSYSDATHKLNLTRQIK